MSSKFETILVLDFGSQYTQLIARRVREAGVYCEIHPFNAGEQKIAGLAPEGLILSGGPASVYDPDAPNIDRRLLDGRPVLGICYGMGILCQLDGGRVARADRREYGPADLLVDDDSDLFAGLDGSGAKRVWMSHGDRMESLPRGYQVIAHSANSPIAAGVCPRSLPSTKTRAPGGVDRTSTLPANAGTAGCSTGAVTTGGGSVLAAGGSADGVGAAAGTTLTGAGVATALGAAT